MIRDEFGYILNKNVKEYLSKNKETNSKKLAMIAQFNPYFNIEDEDDKKRYVNYKDTSIFDYINFAETDEGFIKAFRALKFEEVFKENIKSYLIKMVSKIENIETFGIIMKIINLENNQDKIKEYYDLLKDKYNYIIDEIELLKEEKLTKAIIEILCEFITKIFLNEKSCNFIKNNIEKLDNSIKSLIYNELIKKNKDEKFKEMKDYIFSYFIKNLDDADNIIKLIGNLSSEKDKKQFFKELIEQCKFKKEEFYFDHGNKKIKLLSDLNEKLKEINDEKEGNIFKLGKELLGDELDSILDGIRKDLDSNEFSKNKIEEILQFKDKEKNREEIIKKLGLIKIIINDYNPEEIYNKLKEKIEKMNDIVDRLNFIKNSLSIFHKVTFRDEINNIAKIIEDIEKRPINDFDSETMKNSITDLLKKEEKSKKINKVKDFLIFKIIFKNTKGNDQEARFNNAHEYLKNIKKSFKNYQEKIEKDKTKREEVLNEILEKEDNKKMFKIIKDELSKKKENEIEEFIEQMIENFDIKDKQLENDLKIFFKSKKYEIDIKSIKYFFDAFLDKKLTITKFINLSEMNLKQVKSILVKLKKDNIYDYESESYYYKIFTSLYNKREALDFLMEKITSNTKIDYLKNRLDPTQRRINIKHIEDTIECLKCLSEIIHKDEKEILKNIKNLDKDKVNKFISYSKIYNAIKELDDNDNDNDNDNIVKRITEINQDAYFKISDDKEKFSYKKNKETIDVDIPELIKLKNQINIKPKITKEKNKSNEEMEEKDPYEDKCKNLIFFKDLISDIEEIYEKIKILRTKGCYIPVDIKIEIEFPEFHCFVDGRPYDKEEIKKFLFNVRIDFEKTLNQKYNDEKYLRFLYGKLFRKIQLHNSGFIEIFEIIRYILNITDNSKKILDVKDYAQEHTSSGNYYIFYSDDNNNMLKNISGYIISLFDKNKLDLGKHYNKMLIKEENKYKGFYFKECKKTSMEEYIIYLFYEKLGNEILPISQNILICSKETSTEEIQSFLYRAILCDYNTLFIFEIIESLSESQYNKIFTYIDKILSIKLEKYKTDKNDSATYKIKIQETKEYLNSFIVFVYNNPEVKSNLKELENYSFEKIEEDEQNNSELNNNKENIENSSNEKYNQSLDKSSKSFSEIIINNIKNNFFNSKFKNVKVITSDVCGLGKTYQIKRQMNNMIYYHFPLGGKLSKKIIYSKLVNLFEKINEDKKVRNKGNQNNNKKKKKIGIHIGLSESKEIHLITEFLFSILITNFYIYNEDIIYFPNDFYIYIEIPNCFGENYLDEIGLLNFFEIENIVLGELRSNDKENIKNIKMDDLELSETIRKKFKNILGENREIEENIKTNMDIKKYSFHHILTFIKLFISQHSEMGKIEFKDSYGNDITKTCIENFVETTKYFTNGGFSQLLKKKKNNNKKNNNKNDEFDLYLKAYNSDLKNDEFKTVFYLNSETKKYDFIDLGDTTQENEKKKKRS